MFELLQNPLWALLPPLAVIPFILLFGESRRNLREASILLAGFALLIISSSILVNVVNQGIPASGSLVIFLGIELKLVVEPLGALFAVLASFLWIVTTIYSVGYMRSHKETHQTRFYMSFALAIAAVMAAAYAGNLFTLFVAYEVITLSTITLVTHAGTDAARRAGKIYVILLMGTSIGLLLPALIWVYSLTGTTDFISGGILNDSLINGRIATTGLSILLALVVFGAAKAALMPFHFWLPNAMVAPTPVSALLHAVAVVKTGVFLILKVIIYIFGIETLRNTGAADWLIFYTSITIILASLIAMRKDNLKARLAYSTISQLAYIILAALIATQWSSIGGGLHMITHAFGKITLFFCAGAILVSLHYKKVSQLDGVGKQIPFTMFAFFIGTLSIIGLPPTAGLWSKLAISQGSLEANMWFPIAVLMISSLLNIAYLLPIPFRAFFREASNTHALNTSDHSHSTHASHPDMPMAEPFMCKLAIGITAAMCLILFFAPTFLLNILQLIQFK